LATRPFTHRTGRALLVQGYDPGTRSQLPCAVSFLDSPSQCRLDVESSPLVLLHERYGIGFTLDAGRGPLAWTIRLSAILFDVGDSTEPRETLCLLHQLLLVSLKRDRRVRAVESGLRLAEGQDVLQPRLAYRSLLPSSATQVPDRSTSSHPFCPGIPSTSPVISVNGSQLASEKARLSQYIDRYRKRTDHHTTPIFRRRL